MVQAVLVLDGTSLTCEQVALRLRGLRPASALLAEAFGQAVGALPADTADRPLDGDLAGAGRLLPELARLAATG